MTFKVLQDKVAIVTGAAMGMGEATARLFAEAGAKVVVADFNQEKGESVAADIREQGGDALFVQVDISKGEQVEAMVAKAVEHYGRLDVAVNNAALTPDQNLVSEIDEQYWDRLMSVDLKGTALTLKYELRQMLAQGDGGSIINISSTSGFRVQPQTVAYNAAKHGVNALTKTAAVRERPARHPRELGRPGRRRHPDAPRRDRAVRARPRRVPQAALGAAPLRAAARDRAGFAVARLRRLVVRHRHDDPRGRRLHRRDVIRAASR